MRIINLEKDPIEINPMSFDRLNEKTKDKCVQFLEVLEKMK